MKLVIPKSSNSEKSQFFGRGQSQDKHYCREFVWSHSYRTDSDVENLNFEIELFQENNLLKIQELKYLKIEECNISQQTSSVANLLAIQFDEVAEIVLNQEILTNLREKCFTKNSKIIAFKISDFFNIQAQKSVQGVQNRSQKYSDTFLTNFMKVTTHIVSFSI